MVGDRLYTDIAVAAGTEVTSILVMSGETTPQLLAESPTQPDLVVQDLGELTSLL
ncbi:hAD hydrolase family IIA [Firmicutes bacterium CAG:94]|nr:hAD hydrolase family IIA [Firmicutes bacterium CAG:94]